ncbi:Mfa1 family fimbria major subunit [Parabacteroides distasonis]|uniref:Mfa1 family fimbria major subunit n=1 Tax=Parabacteroides distasonis TaxID=823 RepID=UPI001CCBE21E|nr:Mfa1 family fimbria major subunit [Parabacteroides distasonis]UBD78974.1 Mfa1 family fimbria major subunit [Parabacteroides distasonis]
MKKNYLLSAAAAFLLAVTGCSDDIENGGNSGGEDDGNHAYMNVRISTVADGPMTKADPSSPNTDGGSGWGEDGNGWLGELPGKNEGMVYNVNIFLFETNVNTLSKADHLDFLNGEANPTVAGYGYYDVKTGNGLDASEGGSEPNHGSRNIRITMNSDLDENPKNYQVFAIVNAGADLKTKITSLKELRDYVAEGTVIAKNGTDVANANEFLMSTHKMVSDATPANFPSIVSLSSQNTAENPAKTAVYVERLAARIDLTYNTPVEGKVTLDFDNESSPVNKQGTFYLTGYTLINQWQGNTKMFKQVSPTVDSYEEDLEMNAQYNEGDPLRYLGDEIWQWDPTSKPNGLFNFVLSESFIEKTLADVANNKWENLYRNYFNEGLNDVNKVTAIPLNNPPVSYEDPVNNRTYYPISYVRENTLNTSAQVHGYSTGVIFRTKFTPNEGFKMTEYVNGAISDKAQLDDTENFVFLTAEHFNGKEAQKLVYKNIKTVAARAFNIPDGTDKTNLLKGIMEGWTDDVTSTLADVKTAIEGMSIKNKLEEKFKKYLEDQLSTATNLTPELKNKLTYKGFVNAQDQKLQVILNKTDNMSSITTDEIGPLAENYGVSFFRNGQSYHKFWIRHNDNMADKKMGVMEFCIVRNNVYQLFVKGVRGLGDPLPYTPGKDKPDTPDENNELTIDVTIYVKDWVKRTNKPIIL